MLKRTCQSEPDQAPLSAVNLYGVTCGVLRGGRRLPNPRATVVAALTETEAVGMVRDLMAYEGMTMFGELRIERLEGPRRCGDLR